MNPKLQIIALWGHCDIFSWGTKSQMGPLPVQ